MRFELLRWFGIAAHCSGIAHLFIYLFVFTGSFVFLCSFQRGLGLECTNDLDWDWGRESRCPQSGGLLLDESMEDVWVRVEFFLFGGAVGMKDLGSCSHGQRLLCSIYSGAFIVLYCLCMLCKTYAQVGF